MVAGSAPIATATSMRLCRPGGAQRGDNAPRPACASASACRWCARRTPACDTAAVALAGVGILREHHRQRDEPAAILRPALQHRNSRAKSPSCRITSLHGPLGNDLREERADLGQLRQHLQLADEALGHAHFEKLGDAAGHLVDRVHFERDLHPPHAGEGVDQHRDVRALRLFEQQRRAAGLHAAVGEFGDLQLGIHFERDALQLAVLFQGADELAQVV